MTTNEHQWTRRDANEGEGRVSGRWACLLQAGAANHERHRKGTESHHTAGSVADAGSAGNAEWAGNATPTLFPRGSNPLRAPRACPHGTCADRPLMRPAGRVPHLEAFAPRRNCGYLLNFKHYAVHANSSARSVSLRGANPEADSNLEFPGTGSISLTTAGSPEPIELGYPSALARPITPSPEPARGATGQSVWRRRSERAGSLFARSGRIRRQRR